MGPRSGGGFFAGCGVVRMAFALSADLEARIRDNTDDTKREQAYYQRLIHYRLAWLSSWHRFQIAALLMRKRVRTRWIPWDGHPWQLGCWLF
jgi:hypothetical protein